MTEKVTKVLRRWFLDFGFPQVIRTDNGPQFRGPFDEWCNDLHIIHELSSPYNPQSNGHAEASVKVAKTLLDKVNANMAQFFEHLSSWRNTPRPDGFAPSDLFFGRRLRSQLPDLRQASTPANPLKAHRCVNKKEKGKRTRTTKASALSAPSLQEKP